MPTAVNIFEILAQFATVVGIFLLYRQIVLGRNAVSAQLINELEKEFSDYRPEFAKLTPSGEWSILLTDPRVEDVNQLAKLVAFCEKLKHFLDLGTLNWKSLDLMFRGRFFIIMDNPNVLKYVIEPNPDNWRAVIELKKDWQQRRGNG